MIIIIITHNVIYCLHRNSGRPSRDANHDTD